MYGGLFGDLPSTKQCEKEGEKKKDSFLQVPEVIKETCSTGNQKEGSSVLTGLGNAGTSMAFVPTALRPRKRVRPSSTAIKAKTAQSKFVRKQTPESVTLMQSQEFAEPRLKLEGKDKDNGEGKDSSAVFKNANLLESDQAKLVPHSLAENHELEELHKSVTDTYDPFVPNDLLAYWEHKKIEEERLKLEKEALETLERQRLLRQQLEQERKLIEESGSVNDIIEHRTKESLSGGRGRGINNLPAWLLRKQQEELGKANDSGSKLTARPCTVVLSNLTAPNEVDEDLVHEVKEECEHQCGPVENIYVKDSSPPLQPAVEAIVKFRNVDDAAKAEKLFHGRLFGTRRITARRLSH